MSRPVAILMILLLAGCQSHQVKQEQKLLVEESDDVVLCYSLIDDQFQLDQTAVLRELKSRGIDSCLTTIAEHECPESMESRQSCMDETKVKVTGELKAVQSAVGTELLLKGVQVGIGILPF